VTAYVLVGGAWLGGWCWKPVAQPFGTYTQPLRLDNPTWEALPKVGILCSITLEQVQAMKASGDPVFRELALHRAAHRSLADVLKARRPRRTAPRSIPHLAATLDKINS
jgi:hypothetical protein